MLKIKKLKENTALVSLEAMIILTFFFFFVLFLYSIMIVFLAYNSIANTLLQATESLSLDPIYSETLTYDSSSTDDHKVSNIGIILSKIGTNIFNLNSGNNKLFRSSSRWYKEGGQDRSSQIQAAVKQRFLAYFAEGDPGKAEKKLKLYSVVGGLKGLDFSKSKVENGKLKAVIKYKLSYMFNFYNISDNKIEQSAESKIWLLEGD